MNTTYTTDMKPLTSALLVLLCPTFAAAQFVDYSLVEAQKLHEAGHVEEALARYQAATVADDPTGPLLVQMGIAYAQLGRMDEAKESYEEALDYSPGDPHARYNLAAAHLKTGEVAPALELAAGLHQQLPDNELVTLLLGFVYLEQGSATAAVRVLEPLYEAKPDNPLVGYVLGIAYAENGQPTQAKRFAKTLRTTGKTAEALVLEGVCRYETGDYRKAAKAFSTSLKLKPLRTVQRRLGLAELKLNHLESAERAFRAELEVSPFDYQSLEELAGVLEQDGRSGEAAPFLEQANDMRPFRKSLD